MSKPTRGYKDKPIEVLLIVSSIIMMILAVVSFALGLKKLVDNRTTYMMNDAVQQYAKSFRTGVNDKLTTASTVADILSTLRKNDVEQIRDIIDKVVLSESFSFMSVSDTNGYAVVNNGGSENIQGQGYFRKAVEGKTSIDYTVKSPSDNTRMLLISVPIRTGTEIVGVLSCGYELSKMEQVTQNPSYFGEAYMMIYAGDYNVIYWQDHKNTLAAGKDLRQIFETGRMLGGMTNEQLMENMKNRMGGSFSMEYMGEKRLASYVPIGINDWYAFCYSTFTVYNNETTDISRIAILLVGELAIAIGLLTLYVLRTNRLHSKIISTANIKYEAIISNICGGVEVATYDRDFGEVQVIYVSTGFTHMTGYTRDDIVSLWDGRVYNYVYEKDRPIIERTMAELNGGTKEFDMEYRIVCKDGHIVWVVDRGKIIEDEDGSRQFQSVLTDISVIKEQRDKLAISEERFRIAIESADNMMFDFDCVNCLYVDFSNSERMMGKTREQINNDLAYIHSLGEIERTVEIGRYFYHPDDVENMVEQCRMSIQTGEVYFDARVRMGEDRYLWCRIHLTVINDEDGAPYRVLGFMGNIDVIKRQAELFRIRSEKDALTGFYNKAATISLVNDALDKCFDIPHTMFVMDIDNFKKVNDTLGHIAGDQVISEVGERIRAIFRSDDIIGRVGGDEFVVLIRGVGDVDHILRKAREITNAFGTISVNKEGNFGVSVSIGIEVCRQRSCYEEIFIRADKALYQAKRAGKNGYVFYDKSFSDSSCYTCNDVGGAQVE